MFFARYSFSSTVGGGVSPSLLSLVGLRRFRSTALSIAIVKVSLRYCRMLFVKVSVQHFKVPQKTLFWIIILPSTNKLPSPQPTKDHSPFGAYQEKISNAIRLIVAPISMNSWFSSKTDLPFVWKKCMDNSSFGLLLIISAQIFIDQGRPILLPLGLFRALYWNVCSVLDSRMWTKDKEKKTNKFYLHSLHFPFGTMYYISCIIKGLVCIT